MFVKAAKPAGTMGRLCTNECTYLPTYLTTYLPAILGTVPDRAGLAASLPLQ